MTENFQRVGSISNSHVGQDFERAAQAWFSQQGVQLRKNYSVSLGVSGKEKNLTSLISGQMIRQC